MTDPLDTFPAFASAVRQRLEAGRQAYGDRSFNRPPGELLDEIREELLDVCGWAFIAFERLQSEHSPPERAHDGERLPPGKTAVGRMHEPLPEQTEAIPVTVHLSPHAVVALESLARRRRCTRSAVVETALAHLWTPPQLPPARNPNGEPYVTAYHGIPVTKAQRDEIERRANGGEPITDRMVWDVVDPQLRASTNG